MLQGHAAAAPLQDRRRWNHRYCVDDDGDGARMVPNMRFLDLLAAYCGIQQQAPDWVFLIDFPVLPLLSDRPAVDSEGIPFYVTCPVRGDKAMAAARIIANKPAGWKSYPAWAFRSGTDFSNKQTSACLCVRDSKSPSPAPNARVERAACGANTHTPRGARNTRRLAWKYPRGIFCSCFARLGSAAARCPPPSSLPSGLPPDRSRRKLPVFTNLGKLMAPRGPRPLPRQAGLLRQQRRPLEPPP